MRFPAVVVSLSLGASAAWAQPVQQATPEALAGVHRCAALQDGSARLACYDEAEVRLLQAETEGQIVAIDRAGAAILQRESFGFSLPNFARMMPNLGGGEAIERIETQVERVIERANGRHSFVMSNGQTWAQVEPQSAQNVRVGDTVTIRQAALGSFRLVPRHGAGHRVRRED